MDYAVLVGINAYPFPNMLNGCLDDVDDVRGELVAAMSMDPSQISVLTDAAATADAIKALLANVVSTLRSGDRFVFWYSGHGAQLVDGDVASDVICPVDFAFTPQTSVSVPDFHEIFSGIPDGVATFWGSDSCHSGDLERDLRRKGMPKLFRRDPASMPRVAALRAPLRFARIRDISASLPNIVLMSGCRSDQTSADAFIDGRYNGAFTHAFLRILQAPGGMSTPIDELLPRLQAALQADGYVQMPQLSGRPSATHAPFLQ